MSRLFSPLSLRSLTLCNRVVFPPLSQYSAASDNTPSLWHRQHYGSLAVSGPGLIVIEDTTVEPEGLISNECLGLWSDTQEREMKALVDMIKSLGDCKVGIQLGHAGRRASAVPSSHGKKPLSLSKGGWIPVAPSAIPYNSLWTTPRSLDSSSLFSIKSAFVSSTERAARIGFHALELHYAHGFLMHQFLSPLTNTRSDEYGGKLENRMKFPLEVLKNVRETWPQERPLGVRISATEWVEGGFEVEDAIVFARKAKEIGLDYICVSSGGNIETAKIPYCPGYHLPFAQRIRAATGLSVRTVGQIVTPHQAESALSQADLIAVGTAMVNDPRWVWHAAKVLKVPFQHALPYKFVQPRIWRVSDIAYPPVSR